MQDVRSTGQADLSQGANPAPAAAPGQAAGFRPKTRRVLLWLVVIALAIPISYEIFGFRVTPALLSMICLSPFIVPQFLQRVVAWRLPDLLFMMFVFWQSLTILLNNPERLVAFTGQQTLLTMIGYLSGRLLVRDRQDFVTLIIAWATVSMVSVPFALYEALTDDPVILRIIRDHTIFNTFEFNDYDPRLGLYRAQFVFTHPIHYGLMSAMIIAPFFFGLRARVSTLGRWAGAALIGFAAFLSVSSGAVLSIVLQLLVFVWHQIAARIGNAWRIVGVSGAVFYAILELASDRSALTALSTRLAFSSENAYFRTLIWEFGSAQVRRTPIFGNGYHYWPRPWYMRADSVDNHWLLMAMVHGIPAVVLLIGSILFAFHKVNQRNLPGDPELDRFRLGWTLSLIGTCMSASTVALWGEIQMFFMLILGAGFWMIGAGTAPAPSGQQVPDETQGRARLAYSRFAAGSHAAAARHSRAAQGPQSRPEPPEPPERRRAKPVRFNRRDP